MEKLKITYIMVNRKFPHHDDKVYKILYKDIANRQFVVEGDVSQGELAIMRIDFKDVYGGL